MKGKRNSFILALLVLALVIGFFVVPAGVNAQVTASGADSQARNIELSNQLTSSLKQLILLFTAQLQELQKQLAAKQGQVVATSPTITAIAMAATSTAEAVSPIPSGWDYDLKKKCARTTGKAGDTNFYELTDQCAAGQWTLTVESEKTAGASCPGPINRSYPINTAGSPVTMQWIPHTSELGANWSVNLKVDQSKYPSPCGDGVFTFFSLMDHGDQGGGPIPPPPLLESEHVVYYNHWVPGANDASRMIVGAQAFWGGKAHILEINLSDVNWGDAHPHPGVILADNDWGGDHNDLTPPSQPPTEFVMLNGSYWGISVTPGNTAMRVSIPWASLFHEAIWNGWFEPLTGSSVTQAVYTAVEVKNRAVANMWNTNFRIKKLANVYNAGSDFSSTQEYHNWSYRSSDGNPMTFDVAANRWKGNEQYLLLWNTGGHPGNATDAVRRWTAPLDGTIRIMGQARDTHSAGGDGVVVTIRKNGQPLWSKIILNNIGSAFNFVTVVKKGDTIDFVINKKSDNGADSTYFNPTVIYE